MKIEIEILALSEQKPEQDQRVMVWSEKFKEWRPQVFNKECECWDTEDGDDYERDFDENDMWFSLPNNPDKL